MRERKYNQVITLRLTNVQAEKLKEKAYDKEVSMTDIVRDLIVDCLGVPN